MCVYEMLPQLCHHKHRHWSVIVRHIYHSANSPWLVLRTEIHPGIYLSGVPPFSDLRDAAILCCLGIDGQWIFVLHSELCLKEILITIIIPAVCGFGLWSWNPRLQSYLFVCTYIFDIWQVYLDVVVILVVLVVVVVVPVPVPVPIVVVVVDDVVVVVVLIKMVLYVVCCCCSCCCQSWFPGQLYVVGVMVVFVVVILVVPVLVWFIVGILVVVSPGFQDSFGSCCWCHSCFCCCDPFCSLYIGLVVLLLNIFMHMQVLGPMVCLIEDHLGLLLVLRTSQQCQQIAARQGLPFRSLNIQFKWNRGSLAQAWLSWTNCRVGVKVNIFIFHWAIDYNTLYSQQKLWSTRKTV